jgi:SAM-dependent methyltransferase
MISTTTTSATTIATTKATSAKRFSPPVAPPAVSIVITCYNQAGFLADAIRSALAQSVDRSLDPIEVVVVDDGSTDRTSSVASAFPQVRYIYQPNRGLSAARNAGLAVSRGSCVCFLDADDLLLPEAIECGLRAFEQHPRCAFVYGDFRDVDENGNALSSPRGRRVAGDHYRALLEGNFIGMHATVLYRREALLSVGGFDARLKRCEDYEIYLRLTREFPVHEHGGLVAHYRQHDSNMSHDRTGMLNAVLDVLRTQKPYVRAHAELRRASRKGMAVWRKYYGDMIFDDLCGQLKTAGFTSQTRRSLRDLVRLSPRAFGSQVLRRVKDRLRGKLRRVPLPSAQAAEHGRKANVTLPQLPPGARPSCALPESGFNFGDLRRVTPFSRQFGFDRGDPVDRYYIERFLTAEAARIRGAVLEIGDPAYTRRFGSNVTSSDVLHFSRGVEGATITGDLTSADHIPSDSFDCIILTQTLHFIFDLRAALATIGRILRPGGCVLVTTPGISQICRDQADKESDSWRLTPSSAARLFREYFKAENVRVESYGNVLTAAAFLYGLATRELSPAELDHHDPDYPLIVSIAAIKGEQ